ncbi:uncharacterized protein A1O9_03741 [Exophiala aquamarina CBS 119918]|uniref:NACHT-NTPase and P-loop NTPases N-terminal domain-containing protein n=1 Tax=Exophiala aquamarina CBS 119918 TaxID=1182545 RepID=A0A072PHW4_9EURO|nr:uncharacterized protein A1O9_03741 [Exophiala aquamarina CBS 119918]KEF58898.1 hypothetical protein A1O9_03741 [Exophiala aquamarina CBS 119918]
MSGLDVISGTSAIIGIIDVSITYYNDTRKDSKLSESFEVVIKRLPIIRDTLQKCETDLKRIQDDIPTDVWDALEEIINDCDDKARKVREIFEKVITGEHDGWKKRYSKAIRRLGEGNKVEGLLLSITQDVQLIVNHHAVQSATPEENAKLEEIIEEMKSIKPSVPEEEPGGIAFNNAGTGSQTNNVLGGVVIKRTTTLHSEFNISIPPFIVITQKQDFSYREPAGLCLGGSPYIDSRLFIGRSSELDKMHKILKPRDASREQQRLVLSGMGGLGKTQLAIAYAKKHEHEYESVFCLNASSETSLKDSFRSIAGLIFDIQEAGTLDCEDIPYQVLRWLSNAKNTQWLLIFDNYDDPRQFKIRNYYPPASRGAIIVTARGPAVLGGEEFALGLLSTIAESLEIFEIGLKERPQNLEYEKRWNVNGKRQIKLPEYQDRTLYTTWDVSYSRLEDEDSDAKQLLKMFAYFDNQKRLRDVIADHNNFAGAMRTLTDYHFVEVQEGTASWSIHNCIHDWTLMILNHDIDVQQYWYAFDCIAATTHGHNLDSLEHLPFVRIAAHAKCLVQPQLWENELIPEIMHNRLDRAFYICWRQSD